MTMNTNRSYSELILLPTFEERFQYLVLDGKVGEDIFGYLRFLNQRLYTSRRWRQTRNKVIVRDDGCDLGIPGLTIFGSVHVHHMNPVSIDDLKNDSPCLYDPDNLISCSEKTHRAITLGDINLLPRQEIERFENDMCPWKQ